MAEVVLDKICKSFGSFLAIKDLSLTIRDGEFLTLVGPSGCGKSTALRIIRRTVAKIRPHKRQCQQQKRQTPQRQK